jgi:hypothetical protein
MDRGGVRGVRDRCLRAAAHRLARRQTEHTALVLDVLEQAIFTSVQQGITDLSGLVAHSPGSRMLVGVARMRGPIEEDFRIGKTTSDSIRARSGTTHP